MNIVTASQLEDYICQYKQNGENNTTWKNKCKRNSRRILLRGKGK